MKTLLKSLFALTLGASVAFAGDSKELAKIIEDQGIYVETSQPGIVLSGYVDASYTYQFAGGYSDEDGTTGEVGASSTENRLRQFDVDNNDFNINAVKIALEKALPLENTWAAGFRIDLMFGEDAAILSGEPVNGERGFDISDGASSVFLEQGYVQFRIPVGNGLDVKFGKFVTLLGYEVIESWANPNFSRGLLFTQMIPLTHTGAVAEYKVNDIFDFKFGIVNNWNNSDSDTIFSDETGKGIQEIGKAITGAAALHSPGGNATFNVSYIYGLDGDGGAGGFTEDEPIFTVDVWGQWVPKFADDRLLLAFNFDYGFASDAAEDFAVDGNNIDDIEEEWYGAALYAKYQFTDLFSLAGRAEWIKSENSLKFNVPGQEAGTGASNAYSYTLTGTFDIWENLISRVEYRVDWFDSEGDFDGEGDIEDDIQHQIAVNFVYTF